MEKILLIVVEADDHKNQRSGNYFSKFLIKNKQISLLQVTDANIIVQWLNWNTGSSVPSLVSRPNGSKNQTVPSFFCFVIL